MPYPVDLQGFNTVNGSSARVFFKVIVKIVSKESMIFIRILYE